MFQLAVVVLATGYEYTIPFIDADLFEWKGGRPQLYMNIFNRSVDSLYVVGFIEFADAAYHRFEEMAQLVAMDLTLDGANKQAFSEMKRSEHPNLQGDIDYLDTARNASYVETHAYQAVMGAIRDRFGIAPLSAMFDTDESSPALGD